MLGATEGDVMSSRDSEIVDTLGLSIRVMADIIKRSRQTLARGIADETDYIRVDDVLTVREHFWKNDNHEAVARADGILLTMGNVGNVFELRGTSLRVEEVSKLNSDEIWVVCSNPTQLADDFPGLYKAIFELLLRPSALSMLFISPMSPVRAFWDEILRFRRRKILESDREKVLKPVIAACHFVDFSSFHLITNPCSVTRECYVLSESSEGKAETILRRLPQREADRIVGTIRSLGFRTQLNDTVKDKQVKYKEVTASKRKIPAFESSFFDDFADGDAA